MASITSLVPNKHLQRYILRHTLVPVVVLLLNHQNHKQWLKGPFFLHHALGRAATGEGPTTGENWRVVAYLRGYKRERNGVDMVAI